MNKELKKEIIEAVVFLRENNHTIPSETIQFMKDCALREIESSHTQDTSTVNEVSQSTNLVSIAVNNSHWDESGKLICISTDKECPVNDTVAGSSCSMCLQMGLNGVPKEENIIEFVNQSTSSQEGSALRTKVLTSSEIAGLAKEDLERYKKEWEDFIKEENEIDNATGQGRIKEEKQENWISIKEKGTPTEYGKYEVYREGCQKQFYVTWNSSWWSNGDKDITHYRKIIPPKQD